VINLPGWMLPSAKRDAYRRLSRLAIVEIAGRDSVAAAIKAVAERGFTDLLPTYVYTGTEYGPWDNVRQAVVRLTKRLHNVRIHNLIVLGSPLFWQALNCRYVSDIISRYGFYTPCVGCHLYLHAVRIPLAVHLGSVPIIAGEREWHDKAVKVNQNRKALAFYTGVTGHFGVELALPLRHVVEGRQITEILGFEWQGGKEQLGCVLSGNYRGFVGGGTVDLQKVTAFMDAFLGPCATKIVGSYIRGDLPDHLAVAEEIMAAGRGEYKRETKINVL